MYLCSFVAELRRPLVTIYQYRPILYVGPVEPQHWDKICRLYDDVCNLPPSPTPSLSAHTLQRPRTNTLRHSTGTHKICWLYDDVCTLNPLLIYTPTNTPSHTLIHTYYTHTSHTSYYTHPTTHTRTRYILSEATYPSVPTTTAPTSVTPVPLCSWLTVTI